MDEKAENMINNTINMVNFAVAEAFKQNQYTIPMAHNPYMKEFMPEITGMSFTVNKKNGKRRWDEFEVALITKDSKKLQMIYKGKIVANKSVSQITGNIKKAYIIYAKYLFNKDLKVKEVKKGKILPVPELFFEGIDPFKQIKSEQPITSYTIQPGEPKIKNTLEAPLIEKPAKPENESVETPITEAVKPAAESEPSAEAHSIAASETNHVEDNQKKKDEPVVSYCLNKVTENHSITLKIDKCPYTETFYPWIGHILFEKTQEGTKITASGEKCFPSMRLKLQPTQIIRRKLRL